MTSIRTGNWPLKKRLEFYSEPNPDGCRIWTGAKTRKGYGHLKVKGVVVDSHRLAWEDANGKIPDGMCICHTCDVPSCINADHLFLGTNRDNDNDKVAKGRQSKGKRHADKTRCEKHGMAKLNFEKVFEMRWLSAMGRTHELLAVEYGVSQSAASSAISGHTWQFENHD